jgi:hypothetical protein
MTDIKFPDLNKPELKNLPSAGKKPFGITPFFGLTKQSQSKIGDIHKAKNSIYHPSRFNRQVNGLLHILEEKFLFFAHLPEDTDIDRVKNTIAEAFSNIIGGKELNQQLFMDSIGEKGENILKRFLVNYPAALAVQKSEAISKR